MAGALMSVTLPTIVGMGVTSQAITTLFSKQERQRVSRATGKPAKIVFVGITRSKSAAAKMASNYRKKLANQGKPYTNRVKIKKVKGGYVVAYLK